LVYKENAHMTLSAENVFGGDAPEEQHMTDLTQLAGYPQGAKLKSRRCGDGACTETTILGPDDSGVRQVAIESTLLAPGRGIIISEERFKSFVADVAAGAFRPPVS
jgi:hypothetical protein